MEQLQVKLLGLIKGASPGALDRLQTCLQESLITVHTTSAVANAALRPESIRPELLLPFLTAWRNAGEAVFSPQALALALSSARNSRQEAEQTAPKVSLAWTGPYGAGINARPTLGLMLEMIDAARRRILLVGYDLTAGNESSKSLVNALSRARVRGAQVTVALHDDGENHLVLADLWPSALALPRLLRWVGRRGNQMAKLHAKVLAVDGEDLLVTSANLTWHGLDQNIEVGVRVQGSSAYELESLFGTLEREGLLIPRSD